MFASKDELFAVPSGAYTISRSVRLRSSASAYLNRTPASAGNRRTFTYSFWTKYSTGSSDVTLFSTYGGSANTFFAIGFSAGGTALDVDEYNSSTRNYRLYTNQVFRDPSAWYHVVVAIDTTQATSTNRVKMYVNGSQITSFASATYPSLNFDTYVNTTQPSYSGRRGDSGIQYYDGYLTEINFIDGQQLTPSSFGSTNATTGVWQPAKYTGTYGTNGFYLNFSNNASTTTLGYDTSGNSNNWTTNNISLTAGTTYDSMTDVPTLTSATAANYCVLNPLNNLTTLSSGNLNATTSTAAWIPVAATFGVSSGKWYWEYTITGNSDVFAGIFPSTYYATSGVYPGNSSTSGYGYYGANGNKYNLGAGGASYGATFTTNDIVGVALDLDSGTLTYYKNNTSQGVAASGITGTWIPALAVYNSSAVINFGQQPFTYTPPTGYVALNTYNLPASTIVKGNTVMDATLYTGTGASLSVTNTAGFKPDLVWIKSRSAATDHKLTDTVRGATKALISDTTGAETTDTNGLTAFGTGGFTVGTDTTYNNNTATYVGWQWQAGQGSSASNTNGSITSTVSVNATAGFSVVTYTANNTVGATIGHGLGVAPKFIIVKCRNNANSWNSYHASLGNTQGIDLNSTSAASASSNYWNNTSPTSSVFTVSTYTNNSTYNYVAYCWSEVAGFSKFGSYTGNGSSDGPFVYCGFRPRYVMWKPYTSGAYDWVVIDTARDTYNAAGQYLLPDTSGAEGNIGGLIDILSNGFKLRTTSSGNNTNGVGVIFAAFAENPFKNALAR